MASALTGLFGFIVILLTITITLIQALLELSYSYIERRLTITPRCVRLFRLVLGAVVAFELADKYPTLQSLYSDDGALPRSSALPIDGSPQTSLVWAVCLHAWHGSLLWAKFLCAVQLAAAAALASSYHPITSSLICWWLHCSWCLRNASLVYILDRYLHLLLLYSAFLPKSTEPAWHFSKPSTASCVLAIQLLIIYFDAGYAKYSDPARAWSVFAPVAALDTYLRHTTIARYIRSLLGPFGLRLSGSAAVGIEMLAAPCSLLAPTQRLRSLFLLAVFSLHLGIALTMRNTQLLSAAAITAWLPFIDMAPPVYPHYQIRQPPPSRVRQVLLLGFAALVVHYNLIEGGEGVGCGGRASPDSVRRLLLHNRWNVFASAESYVVWEIAPARLSDGSIVDLWRDDPRDGGGHGESVIAWEVPTGPEPKVHRGRWRAFPYTAERDEEGEAAFWGALCDEWERSDTVEGRRVERFAFYLMQADTLDGEEDGGYGQVRKRLIKRFDCRLRK